MPDLGWRRYLRFWGPDIRGDVDAEVQYHVEMLTRDGIARGLSPLAACEAALRAFGNPDELARTLRAHDTRRLRQTRRWDMLQDLMQDIRYGTRQLLKVPRFTVAVVFVLALGIGANTAIFSAIDAAFLRPLPFPHPEQLVTVAGAEELPAQFAIDSKRPKFGADITDFRADSTTFRAVAAYATGALNMDGGAEPVRTTATYITENFFRALERPAALGRTPAHAEFLRRGPGVVVLSHGFWRRQFGGDTSAIGRRVTLNGASYQVIGVMPADFGFPAGSEIWVPLSLPITSGVFEAFRNFIPSRSVARLAPGVTIARAAQRANAIRRGYKPPEIPGMTLSADATPVSELVKPLQGTLVGGRRTALLVLMASAGLLLLIACANVTNLMLSRAAARQREIAVRAVLGASRGRILRQLLVESLVLALAGGAAALLLARVAMGMLTSVVPWALAAVSPPRIDLRVLGFTLLTSAVISVMFGLWPALGASHPNLGESMKRAGAGGGGSRRSGGLTRNVLVVAEVALALMLLVGAGLMMQSLHRLLGSDTGIKADGLATARVVLPGATYPTVQRKAQFLQDVVTRLRAMPGVTGAASVSSLPMEGAGGISLRVVPLDAPDDTSRQGSGQYLMATPGYFHVMGAAVQGQDLPAFADTAHRVAVINQVLAEKLWPGQNAIGRQIKDFSGGGRTVIGVVSNIRTWGLDRKPTGQMYFPMAEVPQSYAAFVVRGKVPVSSMLSMIRTAVHAVDPTQPLYALRSMDDVIGALVAPRRTNTVLLTLFGGLAVLLASIGVYAVLSYSAAQRTREIGVRVALGAQRGDVLKLVGRQGLLLALLGIAIGLGGAYAFSRVLASILYEVGPHDPRIFVLAPLVLVAVALVATLVPALRATRVDVIAALREE